MLSGPITLTSPEKLVLRDACRQQNLGEMGGKRNMVPIHLGQSSKKSVII